MAKVLLVDTNFSSVPIYRALTSAGHEVHVVGANPSDCLAKQAHHYWQLDYSDIDALSKLVEKQNFDHLIPGCTDRSYESCVALRQERFTSLDTQEVMLAINHKATFRRVASTLGLPVPALFLDAESAVGHTVIVKPVDSFSGKGITVLSNAGSTEIEQAIVRARDTSPSGEMLIEEFVEGQLYSHSAFHVAGKIKCDFLVQEDGTANRFVVDTSRVVDPAEKSKLLMQLRECVEKLAGHLKLQDGLIHTQFISNGNRVWLIEMTRRCPGDLYSQLIELTTGYPYASSYALAFLGQAPSLYNGGVFNPVMRHTISVPAEQSFDYVRFLRALEITRYVPLSLVGDPLRSSPHSRVAILFCHVQNQAMLEELYQATLRRELYSVSDGS